MSLKHLLVVTALSVLMLALGALFGEAASQQIAESPEQEQGLQLAQPARDAAQPAKKPALLAHSFASRWVYPNGPKY
jgi:hypothetical protein